MAVSGWRREEPGRLRRTGAFVRESWSRRKVLPADRAQYVDVYEHPINADGSMSTDLEWKQCVNILPPDADCTLYWADGKSLHVVKGCQD